MKPWMVWPLVAAVTGVLWIAGQVGNDCPQGQIFIPRGFGGACVVGSWR